MAGTAAVAAPSWASVPPASITDLMWLAYGTWEDSRAPCEGGMATAAAWVCDLRTAPVSGRTELPVSRALAESECVAAQLVVDAAAGLPRFPAESFCADLGVQFVPAAQVSVEWADGVRVTLRWLLGRQGIDGPAPPPMALPVRGVDGSLMSEDELYASQLSAAALVPIPEQRREMRVRAAVDAARSWRLVERIRAIQQAASRSG